MSMIDLPTLTLWAEWLPTITWLDKRVENRIWPCPEAPSGFEARTSSYMRPRPSGPGSAGR